MRQLGGEKSPDEVGRRPDLTVVHLRGRHGATPFVIQVLPVNVIWTATRLLRGRHLQQCGHMSKEFVRP